MIPLAEVYSVLKNYNPWWDDSPMFELPDWQRAAFPELLEWIENPPAKRAVLLSGARQVGKTTLFLQVIRHLLEKGVRPEQVLYATFDHPILKLLGLEGLLKAWRELQPLTGLEEYIFIDEVQYTADWQTWLKHQVDFGRNRRIAVTGSAVPINTENPESGVGRWHTIRLPTLSFFEYLQIKDIRMPKIPKVASFAEVMEWSEADIAKAAASGRGLVPHFNEYLLRGGFPQTAIVEKIDVAQKLLREDIVDKVLKRDMTALYGVRRVLELEKTFLYLCLHDGGIVDIPTLCSNLGLSKATVNNFLELLEAAHLIYRLPPFGYGKEVLRAKYKVYLADAAIPGSMLLKGSALLEDDTRLSSAVETAFFKHVFTRFYSTGIGFTYWRGKKDVEVDVVADIKREHIPFEVKYRKQSAVDSDLTGLFEFCSARNIARGYVITRELSDFGVTKRPAKKRGTSTRILRVPATLACYWLSHPDMT